MINLDMPEDVQAYVSEYQGDLKVSKKTRNYSQPQTIFTIIREHKVLKDQLNKLQEAYDSVKSRLDAMEGEFPD